MKNSFKNENTPIVLCSFGIIAFFIAISNADAGNIATASFSYKICVGLSYLIAISIYINHYIYKTSKENKMISKIIGIVFWGAIITISFPYYIQWCGLIGNNFETFVSVYAALLGGGITLAGVAWTIKDGNDKQKESMNLIEQERKEDERKKNTPYVKIVSHVITDDYLDIDIGNKSSLDNFTDEKKSNNNCFKYANIMPFAIKNISEANILLKGIVIDDSICLVENPKILERNCSCRININKGNSVLLTNNIRHLEIIIGDILGNLYGFDCIYTSAPDMSFSTVVDDNESTKEHYIYTITGVNLPKLTNFNI